MSPKLRSLLALALFVAVLINRGEALTDEEKKAKVEELKDYLPETNASTPMPPRVSTLSVTYIPVFLITVALIIIIGLYVYDVFHDLIEEGGVFKWRNDTISLHCSDTSTNQFKFLMAASMLFSIGLIILLAREFKHRKDSPLTIMWWCLDMLAAVMFAFIGIFPTHGNSTKHKVGKTAREQIPEAENCIRCSAVRVYRSVITQERLVLCNRVTCVSRTASKWIHLVTSLYAMIELTASNMLWSWWRLPSEDDHVVLFRGLSTFTLAALVLLISIQACLHLCNTCIPDKIRSILYLGSMGAELCTLLFAVITIMCAILHRDPKVLWIFSTCVGYKT